MPVNIDMLFYWFSKKDPALFDKDALQVHRCQCGWCCRCNDRAFEESLYGTPHLLDYFNDRGMQLKHGVRVSNVHVMQALEILHQSYRKVVQPVSLQSMAGSKVKRTAGFQRLDQLSKILPEPVFASLYDYDSDCKHNFGNYAKLHEDIPQTEEFDCLPILQKHVGKFIVTEYPYMYTF